LLLLTTARWTVNAGRKTQSAILSIDASKPEMGGAENKHLGLRRPVE
jgi:hypothetical protein